MLLDWNRTLFGNLEEMHNNLSRFFSGGLENADPPINILEGKNDYLVEIAVPGADAKKLDVSVQDNKLKLTGTREADPDFCAEACYRHERPSGDFMRTVSFPDPLDTSKVKATYKNGILTVKLGKSESVKPQKIEITAG